MEAVEVIAAAAPSSPTPSRNIDLSPIAKGKRTKRQRPHSPIPFTIAITTHNNKNDNDGRSPTDAASSEESTTTEEVDTARCLILLSRGYFSTPPPHDPPENNNSGHIKAVGGGGCVYTCKTCTRSFPSFQALGGHRASHKKPRNEKRTAIYCDEDDFPPPSMSSSRNRISLNSLSLQLSNASTTTFSANLMKSSPSPRIHECSYCGAEFTSGQALGGHMRKHRACPVARSSDMIVDEVEPQESKKPGNVGLSLDLNLPAPEDEKEKSLQETNQRLRPGFSHHLLLH